MVIEVHTSGVSVGHLRQKAKDVSKSDGIALHSALDRVAGAFSNDQGWKHLPGEEYSWSKLVSEAWRLDSNGVMFLNLPKISTKKAAVEALCERPWPIRLEIASECLTKRGILPLLDNNNLVVRPSRLGFQLTSSLEVKARIHRFIDDEGTLVQRLQAPRKLGCITSDTPRCSCCAPQELGLCKSPHWNSYNEALDTGSMTRMAEWIVGFLSPQAFALGPSYGAYEWVFSTEEAERRLELLQDLEDGPILKSATIH
ncbi:hypothetical protein [Tritonibacter mobilis]|uniref:hypothetical protein n=1 Tax=Tritonibacter mobilis TaxID=379347 RepID=UPI0014037C43|nr:hypothetical protein [Tritonibacter mobilis]NHM24521.1 hypothetical protein [Tritonibacter mobilis]